MKRTFRFHMTDGEHKDFKGGSVNADSNAKVYEVCDEGGERIVAGVPFDKVLSWEEVKEE